jgi:uncharacterized repeat protein (TIGR02543 family)
MKVNKACRLHFVVFALTVLVVLSTCTNAVTPQDASTTVKTSTIAITTAANPTEGGSIGISPKASSSDGKYKRGTSLTVTATAKTGWLFQKWSGSSTSTDNPLTINGDKDLSLTAVFIQCPQLTITCSPEGAGTVSVSPASSYYSPGTVVGMTAAASDGYEFAGWSGDASGTDSSISVTMSAASTITANFAKRQWTIMVYMAADASLDANLFQDLNRMESGIVPSAGFSILALADRSASMSSTDQTWTGTRLYEIKKDTSGINSSLVSKRLASTNLGLSVDSDANLNMGSQSTLSTFIEECKAKKPAENYALIVWGHGSGWRSRSVSDTSMTPEVIASTDALSKPLKTSAGSRAFCVDDGSSGDWLLLQEFAGAVRSKNLSIIGLDTCSGALIETAYEIASGCASYLVASEGDEPSSGWDYQEFLSSFSAVASSSRTARQFGLSALGAYSKAHSSDSGTCISMMELGKIQAICDALDSFSSTLYSAITSDSIRKDLRTSIFATEGFYNTPGDLNVDMLSMAQTIATKYDYADSQAAALSSAITASVIGEWHQGTRTLGGLAIHYIPLDSLGQSLPPHSDAYWKGKSVSNPVSFAQYSSNSWNPSVSSTGLLYRLWYESM